MDIVDEHRQARQVHLAAHAEFMGCLDRVLGVVTGRREGEDLGFGRLRLEQE